MWSSDSGTANLSLKIIRGGTSCYTIALCAQAGHEDAMCSLRDLSPETLWRLVEWVKKLKASGVKSQGLPFTQFSFKRSSNGVVAGDGHATVQGGTHG
jgi:hypothetical protein